MDRVACPWLIRKFIDPKAEFLFVPADKVQKVAESEKAIPYDIPGVELGHHEGSCSFEAIVAKYGIDDPAEHYGWLTAARMIDGLGVAETTPGPLIMVLQFVGFMAGWHQAPNFELISSLSPVLSKTYSLNGCET